MRDFVTLYVQVAATFPFTLVTSLSTKIVLQAEKFDTNFHLHILFSVFKK